jgi:hypothetical protein
MWRSLSPAAAPAPRGQVVLVRTAVKGA